jgi:ABC-2 type transport system permease protein
MNRITVFITAIALVRERETGTLEQLLVTPVTSTEVVLGKILPFGMVAMGAVMACVVASWRLFDLVPVGSTVLLLSLAKRRGSRATIMGCWPRS